MFGVTRRPPARSHFLERRILSMSVLAIVHVAVLLVLVIAALLLAATMAVRPTQRRYEILRPLTWAAVFASLSAISAGLSNTAVTLAAGPMTAEAVQKGWAGLAECLVPGVFGFGLLAVAWGLATIGLRRLD
jgi:hypothetical protein